MSTDTTAPTSDAPAPLSAQAVETLAAVEAAGAAAKLTPTAVANLRRWLTETGYRDSVGAIATFVQGQKFEELEALFWEVKIGRAHV